MFVCLFLYAFRNGQTDFNEIFYMWLSGFLDDLDPQSDAVGPTRGSAQT